MWQPDGWGQTRIGILTPHADVGPESEFRALAPEGISIHSARVLFGAYKPDGTMDPTIAADPVRAFAEPPLVDDATSCWPPLLCMPLCMDSPAAVMFGVRLMMLHSRPVWKSAHEEFP